MALCIESLAKLAPLITATVAIAALITAWRQIYVARKTQLEVQTRALLKDYFGLGLSYPELMHPPLGGINFEAKSINGNKENFLRYEWIVSHALLMANNIFENYKADEYWTKIAKNMLFYHRHYFGWKLQGGSYLNFLDDLCLPLKTYIQNEFVEFRPTVQMVSP
jgi:hypothetical protein